MSDELVQTLDALNNERPVVLQMKRRHLNIDEAGTSHMHENLEWMRINAERERIYRFKSIAQDTAMQYYAIMERMTKILLEKRKNLSDKESSQMSAAPESGADPQQIMKLTFKETQLHNTLKFVTEFIRRVIENGSIFTTGHFLILLLELKSNDVENRLAPYLRVLVEELKVPFEQYSRFI